MAAANGIGLQGVAFSLIEKEISKPPSLMTGN